jgi:hypothetical protein
MVLIFCEVLEDRILVKLILVFHAAAMLLFDIIPKFRISQERITVHHYTAVLKEALVSNTPHKFVRPPF